MKKRILIAILSLAILVTIPIAIYLNAESMKPEITIQDLNQIALEVDTPSAISIPQEQNSSTTEIQDPDPIQEPSAEIQTSDSSAQADPIPMEITESPFEYEGSLRMVADGKVFGEEHFRFSREDDGSYRLLSTGFFQFKILLVNTKFRFQQGIRWNNAHNPGFLSFKLEGPLGVGNREFNMSFSVEEPYRTASIHVGEESEDVRLPEGELAIQGTFSTFAMVPYILGDRREADVNLIIANSFGPTNTAGARSNEIVLSHLGTSRVYDENLEIDVEEYLLGQPDIEVPPDERSLRILIADGELIGLYAVTGDESADSFRIFRTDLFPDGFEIESDY